MAKLDTVSVEDTGHHILLFGPPKSGKTYAAGMLAEHFDVVWLDLEHGFLTLKQLPREVQARIELVQVPDSRESPQAVELMLKLAKKSAIQVCDLHGRVGTCAECLKLPAEERGSMITLDPERAGTSTVFVLDTATQLSESAIGKVLGKAADTKQKLEFDDWASQGFHLARIFNYIQFSRANWVVLTHEESIEQEDGKDKIIPCAGTRNFSRKFAKHFDHVVYCSIKNLKYHQNSDGLQDAKIATGSRTGVSLKSGVTEGLVSLIKSTKGSEEEVAAKAAVQKLSESNGASLDQKAQAAESVKPTPKPLAERNSALAERLAKLKTSA